MRWNIRSQSNHPTRIEFLGYGEDALLNTLQKMKNIINSSVKNYYVRRWAEKISELGKDGEIDRVHSVYEFLRSRTRYLKDPYEIEMLKTPLVSLSLMESGETPALDCDDLTILSLSLLKSIGYPVKLRAVSYRPDRQLTHVYGLVKVKPHGWVVFDLVRPPGLGIEHPGIMRRVDLEV